METQVPGIAEIFTHWTIDLAWIVLLLGAGFVYLRAFRRLNATMPRVPHPAWKAWAFCAGLVIIAIGVLSPIEYYGNRLLFVDFLGFLLITMWAPPLLLIGSPLTLAFRVSGKPMRATLRRAYRSMPVRVITFPITSWLIFAIGTWVWQFSKLTDVATHNMLVRDVQEFSLVAMALIFWTPALCTDPVRWRPPYPVRGLYVFVEMTHKAFIGAIFLAMTAPYHTEMARNLPAWGPNAMYDQTLAILILWIGGNMVFLLAIGGIIARWMAYEGRQTARIDKQIAKEHEAAVRHKQALEQVFRKTI